MHIGRTAFCGGVKRYAEYSQIGKDVQLKRILIFIFEHFQSDSILIEFRVD